MPAPIVLPLPRTPHIDKMQSAPRLRVEPCALCEARFRAWAQYKQEHLYQGRTDKAGRHFLGRVEQAAIERAEELWMLLLTHVQQCRAIQRSYGETPLYVICEVHNRDTRPLRLAQQAKAWREAQA